MRGDVSSQRRAVAAVADAVSVALPGGHEPGVELRGNLLPRMDADVPRKHGVQHKGVLFRGNGAFRVKVKRLSTCVNARVRAAGSGNGDGFSRGTGEGFFQHLLHGKCVQLPLPARIVRAVVFHGAEDAPHTRYPSSTIRPTNAAMMRQAYRSLLVNFSTRRRVRPSPPR